MNFTYSPSGLALTKSFAFLGSTLLKLVNAGNFAAAAGQFGLWVHAGGEVVDGLVRRRKAESELFGLS